MLKKYRFLKTTVRYHLTPVRMAIIKKYMNNKCEEGVKKREPSYTVGGNVSCTATIQNSTEVPQKTKNRITI